MGQSPWLEKPWSVPQILKSWDSLEQSAESGNLVSGKREMFVMKAKWLPDLFPSPLAMIDPTGFPPGTPSYKFFLNYALI